MIVVSLLTYALGKELGIRAAAREVSDQLTGASQRRPLPAVRTIERLRSFDEVMLYHGASTTLPKARSRAAHAALAAVAADLWVMIDDDVECNPETLASLIAIARAGKVAVLPCTVRSTAGDHRVNIQWAGPLITPVGGVDARSVARGGCGLMIVPRAALERTRDGYASALTYVDDDGEQRVALFQQMLIGELGALSWLGEDYSFCERLRACGVDLAAPIDGLSIHDGLMLDLKDAAALE